MALSAPVAAAPQLPPHYQSLGVAASHCAPDHAVDLLGNAIALPNRIAAQAKPSPSTVSSVVAPHWYTPTILSGADAAHAYSATVNTVFPQVISAASSTSSATGELTRNSRPTSASGLDELLGHYVVNQGGGAAGTRAGRQVGSATWSLSATRPMGDGTTLQVQSQGAVAAGKLRGASYSVFTTRTPTTVQPATPLQLSFDLRLDGSAVVTATEVLSNSTAVVMSVHMPNMLADPAVAAAVKSEQGPLRQLSDVVNGGSLGVCAGISVV